MGTILIANAERERLLQEAIAKVRGYRLLPMNWDSYGGEPASDQAAAYAVRLLTRLCNSPEISVPFVSPISNGVYLEWKRGSKDLYLEIDQTSVLVVMRADGEITFSEEDPSFDVERTSDLLTKFNQSADKLGQ